MDGKKKFWDEARLTVSMWRWLEWLTDNERQDLLVGVPGGFKAEEFDPPDELRAKRLAAVQRPVRDRDDVVYDRLQKTAEREAPADFAFYAKNPKWPADRPAPARAA